jgi:serine/threonine protein kinase HipA of HipAB toxin-antitoxin module
MSELFRRLMFNVLIQNTDDHLRNLGFLYRDAGKWGLSPAYDVNPVPEEGTTLKTCDFRAARQRLERRRGHRGGPVFRRRRFPRFAFAPAPRARR